MEINHIGTCVLDILHTDVKEAYGILVACNYEKKKHIVVIYYNTCTYMNIKITKFNQKQMNSFS